LGGYSSEFKSTLQGYHVSPILYLGIELVSGRCFCVLCWWQHYWDRNICL